MSGLSTVLEAMQAQIKDIENHLKAFADVSDQAKDAIPRIEEVLLTTQMAYKQLLMKF